MAGEPSPTDWFTRWQHDAQASTGCHGVVHAFRPYVGDPVPGWSPDGLRCECGERVIRRQTCNLGHEHVEQHGVAPQDDGQFRTGST